jgi:hypothetical protein
MSLPSVRPAPREARGRLPSSGSFLGLTSPPSPVLCAAKTASRLRSRPFAWRSRPETLPASVRSWCPLRARGRVEAPRPRQGLWSSGPSIRKCRKETGDLPRSRAPPIETCPALRPRWCSVRSPCRVQDCCLPATGNRRLSSPSRLEGYPPVHDSTHFGAPSCGLAPRSLQLHTPMAGRARGVHSRPAGQALIG